MIETEENPIAPVSESKPFQFGLSRIFLLFWCVAWVLGTLPVGVLPFLALGLPAILLGCSTGSWTGTSLWTRDRVTKAVSLSATILCLLLAWKCIQGQTPADQGTWMILAGPAVWSLWVGSRIDGLKRYFLLAVPCAVSCYVCIYLEYPYSTENVLPVAGVSLVDVRNSSYGIGFLGMRFSYPGPNEDLVVRYLGKRLSKWKYQASFGFTTRSPNVEYVNVESILFDETLPDILDMLPSEGAKRQVLHCLTDETNLARAHQGLLLAGLYSFGYPSGFNRDSWWEKHEPMFHQIHDADAAVRMTWGWRHRVRRFWDEPREQGNERPIVLDRQFSVAGYQERGSLGGDDAFYNARVDFMVKHQIFDDRKVPLLPNMGVNEIAWW